MPLTEQDLDSIRTVVTGAVDEGVDTLVVPQLDKLHDTLESVKTDVAHIKNRLSNLDTGVSELRSGQRELLEALAEEGVLAPDQVARLRS